MYGGAQQSVGVGDQPDRHRQLEISRPLGPAFCDSEPERDQHEAGHTEERLKEVVVHCGADSDEDEQHDAGKERGTGKDAESSAAPCGNAFSPTVSRHAVNLW